MLVLGRKPGEYVVIDERIIVKVVKGENGQFKTCHRRPERDENHAGRDMGRKNRIIRCELIN